MNAPRLRTVFAAYALAVVSVVTLSLLAAAVLRTLHPELDDTELFDSLPGLLAGALASSAALGLTLLAAARPLDPARLRLRPGRETGATLALMILGTLALGQALDSAVTLAGLAGRGTMAVIRRALEGTTGADLFAAVLIIGLVAGSAEEVFFRGYLQTTLRQRWGPAPAVVLAAGAFAVLHLEPLHVALSFALGLWFGFVTEQAQSALPAVAAHVVNNVVFTLLTALGVTVGGVGPNVVVGLASVLVFLGCAAGVSRGVGAG
jgi:membrane protease YdiL (CAAX protease family)